MTEADELFELKFYRVPESYPATFYCGYCLTVFFYIEEQFVKEARTHRGKCD